MHFEILIEDSSGKRLLEHLMPKLVGPLGDPHTWRLHAYRGVGRIPKGLATTVHPSKRILLDQLPRLLRGYVKTRGIDAVIVIVDTDDHNCHAFLTELRELAKQCDAEHLTMFRLAIEETEAWYIGDRHALTQAYPNARTRALDTYVQDSIVGMGTWELLADITYDGGIQAIRRRGWPAAGDLKHEWADRIGPHLDPEVNQSVSFGKLRDGVRRLAATSL